MSVMRKTISLEFFLVFSFWISSAHNKCGIPIGHSHFSGRRENRIVGGYDVGYYKYPWYVAFIKDKIVGCGGTLVNSRTVLTAAHCFQNLKRNQLEEYYVVKLGIYNICTAEKTQSDVKVEKVKVHELYSKKNPYYDLAIVIVKQTASQFTPICLPSHPILNRPREGLVAGLGVLKYSGATPCTLRESRLLIQSDEECKSMLTKVEKNVSHIIKAFCAGYKQGGIDTCQGDSGGALQVTGSRGEYIILGVVSFGYKCAAPGVLGLYTDVSQHLGWIKKNAEGVLPETDVHVKETSKPIVTTVSTVPKLPISPQRIPLPSIQTGLGSMPFLQFVPMRPIRQQPLHNRPPLNIYIFNTKKLKKRKSFIQNQGKKKNRSIQQP